MKKFFLAVILTTITVSSSGCATIIGGIIGYQSGEAVAGAAIGAAIDIVSHISEAEKEKQKKENVKIFPDMGYLRIDNRTAQNRNLTDKLLEKFQTLGWQYNEIKSDSADGNAISSRIWQCRAADSREFTLEVFNEKSQDLRIYVRPSQENPEFKSMLTSQIGFWVQEIVKR